MLLILGYFLCTKKEEKVMKLLSHYRLEGKRGKSRGTDNTKAYFRFWLELRGKDEL